MDTLSAFCAQHQFLLDFCFFTFFNSNICLLVVMFIMNWCCLFVLNSVATQLSNHHMEDIMWRYYFCDESSKTAHLGVIKNYCIHCLLVKFTRIISEYLSSFLFPLWSTCAVVEPSALVISKKSCCGVVGNNWYKPLSCMLTRNLVYSLSLSTCGITVTFSFMEHMLKWVALSANGRELYTDFQKEHHSERAEWGCIRECELLSHCLTSL